MSELSSLSKKDKVFVLVALSVFAVVLSQFFISSSGGVKASDAGASLTGSNNIVNVESAGVDVVSDSNVVSAVVETGDFVKVHYKGTLSDGSVFDSSEGRDPLYFKVGAGQMIKGFDAAVVGMKEGEKKTVVLPPSEAYGESNPDLIKTVDVNQLGSISELHVGQNIYANSSAGSSKGVVTAVNDGNVVIDFNHELAGKTLTFEITLVAIEKA